MKKFNLDPMSLDKETIAMLDDKQLLEVVGGQGGKGSSSSSSGGGGSTGCGSGSSTCRAIS